MRAYKKKKFDLANLKNELTGAVDKLERDKKQGKIRVSGKVDEDRRLRYR
jgi:hypothetical protein